MKTHNIDHEEVNRTEKRREFLDEIERRASDNTELKYIKLKANYRCELDNILIYMQCHSPQVFDDYMVQTDTLKMIKILNDTNNIPKGCYETTN